MTQVKISILLFFFILSGCKDTITLSSSSLVIGTVSDESQALGLGTYLILQFKIEALPEEIPYDDPLLQTHVLLIKDSVTISDSFGRGPFGWNGQLAADFENTEIFATFLYQNFEVYSGETGRSQKLMEIDFDKMVVFVRYTQMVGEKFRSNELAFSKDEIRQAIQQNKIAVQLGVD